MLNISKENQAMMASYARSLLGAAVATYVATQDWKATLNAFWAAALPVIIRWVNSSDTAFGRKKGDNNA